MRTQLHLARSTAPSQKKSAHVCCGQTAGWIKMPLGTKVGLDPDRIVLHGTQIPLPKGTQPPIFGPCLLWPNGLPSQLLLSIWLVITCANVHHFSKFFHFQILKAIVRVSCKEFPPHTVCVTTLTCETWNLERYWFRWRLEYETPEFAWPHMRPPRSPDLNPVG